MKLSLAMACLFVCLCAVSGQAKDKDKIKLDAKQTSDYRTLMLTAANSKLAVQNLELQFELALAELSSEWLKAKTVNQRARQFLSDQFLAQLAKARDAEQQAQTQAYAYLTDVCKAAGVAESELLNYELREVEGKFELHRRSVPSPSKAETKGDN